MRMGAVDQRLRDAAHRSTSSQLATASPPRWGEESGYAANGNMDKIPNGQMKARAH